MNNQSTRKAGLSFDKMLSHDSTTPGSANKGSPDWGSLNPNYRALSHIRRERAVDFRHSVGRNESLFQGPEFSADYQTNKEAVMRRLSTGVPRFSSSSQMARFKEGKEEPLHSFNYDMSQRAMRLVSS